MNQLNNQPWTTKQPTKQPTMNQLNNQQETNRPTIVAEIKTENLNCYMNVCLLALFWTTYTNLKTYLPKTHLKSSHTYFFFKLDIFQMLPQHIQYSFFVFRIQPLAILQIWLHKRPVHKLLLCYTVLTTHKFISDDQFLCKITAVKYPVSYKKYILP